MSLPSVRKDTECPTLLIHDAANIFPLDIEHLDKLADDIRLHGLHVPIETLGGKIIDGRRRALACQKAGVDPVYRAIEQDDPISYVLSLNLHRRQMTPGERAMAAAKALPLYEQQAKERQLRKPAEVLEDSVPVNLPEQIGDSRDAVGKVFGVSGKMVDHATRVLEFADPEVVQAVEGGRMAVSAAALLSHETPDVQRETVLKGHKRCYRSLCKPTKETADNVEAVEGAAQISVKGLGIIRANEAINCLMRIPKNDALRARGFQLVNDWITHNR